MKYIKWLLDLANRKPLLFSLALLLIVAIVLGVVVIDRDKKLNQCLSDNRELESKYLLRVDSLAAYYKTREEDLTNEVRETLAMVLTDYKNQVADQKELIDKLYFTIMINDKIIKDNRSKLQKLKK